MTTITLDNHRISIKALQAHTDAHGFIATNPITKTLFSSSALLKILDTPALCPAGWTRVRPEERDFFKKQPPLFFLARQGELRTFQMLLAKDELRLSLTASNGANLLHFAASGGHIPLAAFLLTNHLSAASVDTIGHNALDYATRHNQSTMAAWLLEKKQLPIKTANHPQLKLMLWQQASKAAEATTESSTTADHETLTLTHG